MLDFLGGVLKHELLLFKLFSSLQSVNSRAEILHVISPLTHRFSNNILISTRGRGKPLVRFEEVRPGH